MVREENCQQVNIQQLQWVVVPWKKNSHHVMHQVTKKNLCISLSIQLIYLISFIIFPAWFVSVSHRKQQLKGMSEKTSLPVCREEMHRRHGLHMHKLLSCRNRISTLLLTRFMLHFKREQSNIWVHLVRSQLTAAERLPTLSSFILSKCSISDTSLYGGC